MNCLNIISVSSIFSYGASGIFVNYKSLRTDCDCKYVTSLCRFSFCFTNIFNLLAVTAIVKSSESVSSISRSNPFVVLFAYFMHFDPYCFQPQHQSCQLFSFKWFQRLTLDRYYLFDPDRY